MIPKSYIERWKYKAPWNSLHYVEQDLIISRALVLLFSDEFLKENLAFRGGTALHKLYLSPSPRYSEDIDLVQIKEGRIKPILKRIAEVITFFEEKRTVKQKLNNNTILYRYNAEFPPKIRLRLKIEINCREHFNVLGWEEHPFEMQSDWFSGTAQITTYKIEELLATKLRALYQRKKGRDLFDLYYAFDKLNPDIDKLLYCYEKYMGYSDGKSPTKKQFLINIEEKKTDLEFWGDMEGLLRSDIEFGMDNAFEWLIENLLKHFK
ncbi:MAG: nucleotidyl transferase AbiEii/AbiGii toxin family protein [Chitinophagales bacterium]